MNEQDIGKAAERANEHSGYTVQRLHWCCRYGCGQTHEISMEDDAKFAALGVVVGERIQVAQEPGMDFSQPCAG